MFTLNAVDFSNWNNKQERILKPSFNVFERMKFIVNLIKSPAIHLWVMGVVLVICGKLDQNYIIHFSCCKI